MDEIEIEKMENLKRAIEERGEIFVICPCGKVDHYSWANYCGHCGLKLEKAEND